MNEPSITVVLPLYNHEHYIKATLESVLRQTSPATEIILVDDGSTDKGFSIAEKILANHSETKLVTQINSGAHTAINNAISIAHCEYIAILNTDDLFFPTKLERCRWLIRNNPTIEFIAGGVQIIDKHCMPVNEGETVEWLHRAISYQRECASLDIGLLNENYVVTTSNMVFTKDLWYRVDGFQHLRYCHDLDFIHAALGKGTVMIDIAEPHIKYRIHPTNTIKENIEKIRLEVAAVTANFLHENGKRLFIEKNVERLISIINAKNDSGYLSLLLSLRNICSCRKEYYERVNSLNI
ncbi:MAG: glycosyltransferase family 2 protein [Chlorobium sp.]|nr:MAG: glycosyltransferase family 2 protein [Chlorobium sp.]